ncbi:MAG: hypothetical protein QMD09_06745 [Desulfatibacillaceae bacterium]|nr:hypothetical protein [Desulfatibacillaceae bacterium]
MNYFRESTAIKNQAPFENQSNGVAAFRETTSHKRLGRDGVLDMNSLLALERISEVEMMCARNNPIYGQISGFGIALYVLGCFDARNLLSVDDLDSSDAAAFLRENFVEVDKLDLPPGYEISRDAERYLMVLGDPVCPSHFAVIVDMESKRPFFSKLRYFGSGYDSLEELIDDHLDEGIRSYEDVHYFKLI